MSRFDEELARCRRTLATLTLLPEEEVALRISYEKVTREEKVEAAPDAEAGTITSSSRFKWVASVGDEYHVDSAQGDSPEAALATLTAQVVGHAGAEAAQAKEKAQLASEAEASVRKAAEQ